MSLVEVLNPRISNPPVDVSYVMGFIFRLSNDLTDQIIEANEHEIDLLVNLKYEMTSGFQDNRISEQLLNIVTVFREQFNNYQ